MEIFAAIMIWPVLVFAVSGFLLGVTTHSKVSALEKRVKALESANEK